jgi:hypothetical protein
MNIDKNVSGQEKSWRTLLWRTALRWSALSFIVATVAAFLLRGTAGGQGALLAGFVVIIFFAVHLLLDRATKGSGSVSLFVGALLSYFLKVALVGSFLFFVMSQLGPERLDRISFGATAMVITTFWLAGEIRGFMRIRYIYDDDAVRPPDSV